MENAPTSDRMTRDDLADSLIIFRRHLAERIIVAMIRAAGPTADGVLHLYHDPAEHAEDLANAITERLAARETGNPRGYK